MSQTRRHILTGRMSRPAPEFRPPWTTEARITALCTRCGDCAPACPQGIIEIADGHPRIRMNGSECTFCGDCAAACKAEVFQTDLPRPWPVRVEMGNGCLLGAGITCQLCTDACDSRALRFDLRVRPVGGIEIKADACTGCGACLAVCPTGSLRLHDDRMTERAA